MGFTLRLEFFGDEQVNRTLDRVTAAVLDMRPAFEQIANDFASIESALFASEGRSGASGGWAPLSPAYAAWKASRFPGAPTLEATGQLARSLTGRPFPVENITRDSMEIGSNVDYGRFHQAGTPKMPARKPVDLTDSQKREWVKIMQRHILGGVSGAAGSVA